MKKIIRLTESDLVKIVKKLIKEQTEGENEFIQVLEDRYDLSKELKTEIVNTFKSSDCKNVKFQHIKMGEGVCLGDRLILNPSILNYTLGKALFIIFHELAHQYQFKKYGKEKMLELYEDHITLSDAAKFMYNVEQVADEFAVRKLKSLEKKGLIEIDKLDLQKAYDNVSTHMLQALISNFRNRMRQQNVTGSDKVAEFLYNMVKIEQSSPIDGKSYRKDLNTKNDSDFKKSNNKSEKDTTERSIYDGIEDEVTKIDGNLEIDYITDLNDLVEVTGNVSVHNDEIESLQNLEVIGGKLWITSKSLVDFGNLKSVGSDLIIGDTSPLSKKYTEEDIRNMINVGGRVDIRKY
jgi:hypothetical protein